MKLEIGQAVTINIARVNRWAKDHVLAFNGLVGFVEEIKPENGDNNILVSFPEPVITTHNRHNSFHFLKEDLTPEEKPLFKLIDFTQTRRNHATNMLGLYQFVDCHGYHVTWDNHKGLTKVMRGVIWTAGDALAGHFHVTNSGVLLSVYTDPLLDWW